MDFIYWAKEKLKAQQNKGKNSAKLIDRSQRENDVMEFWCCNHFSIFFLEKLMYGISCYLWNAVGICCAIFGIGLYQSPLGVFR